MEIAQAQTFHVLIGGIRIEGCNDFAQTVRLGTPE